MAETPSAKLDQQAIDMNGVRSQENPPTPHPTPHPASAAGYRRALLKPSTLKRCVPQMVLGERLALPGPKGDQRAEGPPVVVVEPVERRREPPPRSLAEVLARAQARGQAH